jgi:decaprenyl-phosphate phosphoribosyltransferase
VTTELTAPVTGNEGPRAPASNDRPSGLGDIIRCLRPVQWVKNLLVLAGAILSEFDNAESLRWAFAGALAFTLASSAVYLGNDIRDRHSDAQHPQRCNRPIAAGRISVRFASAMAVVLMTLALIISYAIGILFLFIVFLYLTINIVYSLGAKRVVILDAMLVGLGFVLRVVAGAVAIEVPPSSWIIVCTLEMAMLVVFGKRRVDLLLAERSGTRHLLPKEWYPLQFLDLMMATAASASIVTYALYTLDPQTVLRVGNRRLVLTLPMAVYGVLRYLFLVFSDRATADPTSVILKDWGLRVCGLMWIVTAVVAVYS